MTPTVTAVIPCYNQGPFLADCLQSLRAQTVQTWRAIVLNDASTDGQTPAICDSFADDRVEVIHLPHNLGRALVRNVGIERCNTEAILNLDADDKLEPDYFARTIPLLLGERDIGVVYTDYRWFGVRDGALYRLFGVRDGRLKSKPFDLKRLYREQYIGGGSLFRRSAWEKTRGYHADFTIGNEDYDFWLSLVEGGFRGAYLAEPLYCYRIHPQSWTATMAGGSDRIVRSREALLHHHRAGFEQHGAAQDFEFATYLAEARRLARVGDRCGAQAMWRRVLQLDPWNFSARLGVLVA